VLILNTVNPLNSGSYQAMVFNNWGVVKSSPAVLRVVSPSLPLADAFASRGLINTASGQGSGSTATATTETNEPSVCGQQVFKSVWLTWIAPADGVAVFSTVGSAFDTVLSVHTGTSIGSLVEVASDDDAADFHASQVMFNALAGKSYQIRVASPDKAGGDVLLNWQLVATSHPLPIILSSPTNLTALPGAPATLCVQYQSATPMSVQWYRNGQPIPGATSACLQWSQLTLGHLGTYEVSLSSPDWT
jgi:hypothetical protein